jgi:hypothetical protein
MDKEVYRDLLDNVALPSIHMLFPDGDFIFQQDNDPKHTAKINKQWFDDNDIELMDWPSRLNPIENLWSIIDDKLRYRKCNTEADLFAALQVAWRALSADLMSKLAFSMPVPP